MLPRMAGPQPSLVALTRGISPAMAECELTHLQREPIDVARARDQHSAYEATLRSLGCRVESLPALATHPDCVFVEDCAVVVDEVAVVTRPGARSRRGETPAVAEALARHRPLLAIEGPGTLDGGDVLCVGRRVFVGRTPRSDAEGRRQLRDLLAPYGYEVVEVEVRGCLHLKTAVTALDDELLLVFRPWLDEEAFASYELLDVDPDEPFAANALAVAGAVVMPAAFAHTRRRVEARGIDVRPVDVSETAKAEGGVTCCSVVFTAPTPPAAPGHGVG
jgi:dimethylargininase